MTNEHIDALSRAVAATKAVQDAAKAEATRIAAERDAALKNQRDNQARVHRTGA